MQDLRERFQKVFSDVWVILVAAVGAITFWVGFWDRFREWSIIGALFLLSVVMFIKLIYQSISLTSVEYEQDEEKVKKKVTDLLRKTKKSLYYYGGSGFIGDYQHWREEFHKKLEDESIKIVRLMDLKTLAGMKKLLEGAMSEKRINDEIHDYKQWLNTHSSNLRGRIINNAFYDFDGAPIWKFGTHFIVFDKKYLVIIFLRDGQKRNAMFIKNRPDIAGSMVESIEWITRIIGIHSLSSKELHEKINLELDELHED